jgi:hypothetical protein
MLQRVKLLKDSRSIRDLIQWLSLLTWHSYLLNNSNLKFLSYLPRAKPTINPSPLNNLCQPNRSFPSRSLNKITIDTLPLPTEFNLSTTNNSLSSCLMFQSNKSSNKSFTLTGTLNTSTPTQRIKQFLDLKSRPNHPLELITPLTDSNLFLWYID